MAPETLTPVPLNPETVQQHVVIRGEAARHTTDDDGFMEGTLHSQNGEARTESRSRRPRVSDGEDHEKTPFLTRLKDLVGREPGDGNSDSEKASAQLTTPELTRAIKKLDRRSDGLVGKIAETGTKVSFLEAQLSKYHERMEAHGHDVNDTTRKSVEGETLRKLLQKHMDFTADKNSLEGDDRKEYEKELVDTFRTYVHLSDDEREDVHNVLNVRYRAAHELDHLKRESQETDKTPLFLRASAAIGSFATRIANAKSDRKEAHGKDDSGEDQPGLFDEKPYRKSRNSKQLFASATDKLKDLPRSAYFNLSARITEGEHRRLKKLDTMSDEERENYEKKHKRRNKVLRIGAAAVAVVGVGLAVKFGFDHLGGDRPSAGSGNQGGDLSDLLNIPSDNARPQDVVTGTEFVPTDTGGGSDADLSRNELFTGREGSRSLSGTNTENLKDFLGDYKVKAGDDKGVWGISEKYLESQGVKNPTVFETDAVKDYILKHSSLTSSSIIYPGDTIKLK